jgi:DNA modification methylase
MSECRLIEGDCIQKMREIGVGCVDLICTSPPYNLGISYIGSGHNDSMPMSEYREWAGIVMKEMWNVLKEGGRACVEIGGSGRNSPFSWIWQDAAYAAGFGLFSEIGIQHRKTNPTAWGSYLKADAVYTIPNFHMLYVFYKVSERKVGIETTITKEEFVEWTRGYWRINYSGGGERLHPAQFPLSIPVRCMKLFGHQNDLVLDPFMGSGTTGSAAYKLQRDFVGIELSPIYFALAKKNIEGVRSQMSLFDIGDGD